MLLLLAQPGLIVGLIAFPTQRQPDIYMIKDSMRQAGHNFLQKPFVDVSSLLQFTPDRFGPLGEN